LLMYILNNTGERPTPLTPLCELVLIYHH
jgi:hypothetical protein